MNCPKCNSPINDGDKFCQVCGSVINHEPQPATNVENPVQEATPVVNEPVVNEQTMVNNMPNQDMNQPAMNNQPMNYNQQPMPNVQPMNTQPMNNNVPQESKKNNTVVIILVAVIVVLLAAVIYLFATSGSDDEKETPTTIDKPTTEPTTEPTTAKYTTTTVNGFKFQLPEGYSVELYEGEVVVYNENIDFEAYVDAFDGLYDNIDKEGTKASLTAYGYTNVTYKETTINNRKMLIYTVNYNGYTIEYIYVKYSSTKVTGATVIYNYDYDNVKDTVYEIIAKMEVEDSVYSTTASVKLPEFDMNSALTK